MIQIYLLLSSGHTSNGGCLDTSIITAILHFIKESKKKTYGGLRKNIRSFLQVSFLKSHSYWLFDILCITGHLFAFGHLCHFDTQPHSHNSILYGMCTYRMINIQILYGNRLFYVIGKTNRTIIAHDKRPSRRRKLQGWCSLNLDLVGLRVSPVRRMSTLFSGFWLKEEKERATVIKARITNSVKLITSQYSFRGASSSVAEVFTIMMDVCIDQLANGNISSAVENRPLRNYQNSTWPWEE